MSGLQLVATRVADVSPAWAGVTIAVADGPEVEATAPLGLDRQHGFESIREGWLLHRGASRLAAAASPDLALLVGDWCYADGLCSIAEYGTLDDVAELAELIADVAARSSESIDDLTPRWERAAEALRHG